MLIHGIGDLLQHIEFVAILDKIPVLLDKHCTCSIFNLYISQIYQNCIVHFCNVVYLSVFPC